MIDQCGNCVLRGNIKECKAAPCNHHESWYAVEQQKRIDELVAENKRLRDGLSYYAKSRHCSGKFPSEWVDWDTCSGEPQNWWFNTEEIQEQPVGIEDGSIAQMVLNGAVMTPESDETECVFPDALKERTE